MAYQIQGSVIINDSRELVNVGASTISTLSVTSATTTEDLVVNGTVGGTAGILTTGALGGPIAIGDSLTADSAYITNDVQLGGAVNGPANLIIDPAPLGGIGGTVSIKGDLVVEGTEFIVESTTVSIADKKIGVASATGTDLLLDGSGIGIGSANVEKTFLYNQVSETLQSSIGLGVVSGESYKVASTEVLSETTLGSTVVNSSLTSVGSLTDLTVTGDINANGNIVGDSATNISGIASVTASTFYGNGSGLTNLSAEGIDLTGTDQSFRHVEVTGAGVGVTVTNDIEIGGTATIDTLVLTNTLAFVGATEAVIGIATVNTELDVNGPTSLVDVQVSGAASITGDLTVGGALNLTGDITLDDASVDSLTVTVGPSTFTGNVGLNDDLIGDGASNISGIASVTATTVYANLTGDVTGNLTGDVTATNVSASSSVTAANFYGSGEFLTGISGDAVSMLVADNQDNTDYPMIFASAVGAGASIYSDSTTSFEFTYNPSTGTATAATFDSVSDERLKDNITQIADPVAKLAALRGVEFDWKGIEGSSVGVIAQDVAKVYPQLVTDHGERLTVNYDGLVGLLVRAVQELTARVEELEGK